MKRISQSIASDFKMGNDDIILINDFNAELEELRVAELAAVK